VGLLADENLDLAVVVALRNAGHDVVAMREAGKGAPDELVIRRALNERRVLLTEDKDFGELVYKFSQPSPGVILLRRFESAAQRLKCEALIRTINDLEDAIFENFVVVEPGRMRVRRKRANKRRASPVAARPAVR
jgi:predicted nuclease of predicted toxin-antitoxin system